MNTKQVITTLGITALLSASTAWADNTTEPSQQQKHINKISNCSQLKYPQLHSNVCEGAQRFADGVNEIAKKIIPGAFSTSGSKFTFYEQAPDKPTYEAQTPNPCKSAFKPSFGTLKNPADLTGGGTPLCNMLMFVESAQGQLPFDYTSSGNHKQPITYFNSLIDSNSVNNFFGHQVGPFAAVVKKLGSSAVSIMTETLPSKTGAIYYPEPPYTINKTNKTYHGISGGGGSGAGFEIFVIYKNKSCIPANATPTQKNKLKVAVFTGGFGGGGGITSPEIDAKLSAGAGGGGGLQFYNGLGLGAGASHASKEVGYSYNAGEDLSTISKHDRSILNQYLHLLEPARMAAVFKLNKKCVDYITIEGGGGMGSGFELLNKNAEEYATHAYSSEGGFQFTYQWKWAEPQAMAIKRVATPTAVNPDLTPFYQAMGGYWAKVSKSKSLKQFKKICKGSWGKCPNCLFSLQNYSIFCKAKQQGTLAITQGNNGKLLGIPAYMLISYPTGPKTQCKVSIKPLNKKTSYQQFVDICKRVND